MIRLITDLSDDLEKAFVVDAPAYNTLCRFPESEETTPILLDLIFKSSLPLEAIETDFAVHASGYSSSKFDRWFDENYGVIDEEYSWCKAHISAGVQTHVNRSRDL